MDQSDRSHSPSRNFFDPTNLLGSSPFSPAAAAANPYAHLAHLPSAFSMLGHPGFPGAPPFGGLGSLDPLRSPSSVLSSTTGGADWWRAASDHARRTAGFGDVDFLVGTPTVGLPGQQQVTSGDNGAVYRPLEESKHLNGAYSSLFGLPTYTSASASMTTKSSTSQDNKHSKSSKSDLSAASTPLSPPGKRSASPASSTTSSHSSSSRAKEGGSSKGSKHRDGGVDKTKNGPSAAAMSISKYDEEVAKSLSSMFAFPDTTAGMLGPSMFSAPPMFSYPYGAGALFAAHHASLFGMPMVGHPSMPFSMGMSLPSSVSTSHSTTSSSRGGTKTTSSTTTTPSSAVSKSASSTPRTPTSSSKQAGDSKSRKNLFGEHHSGPRPDGGLSSPPATPHRDSHHPEQHPTLHKQQPREQTKPLQLTNHSSPRVRGASSDSDSLPDVSSDSLSDDSDLENDRSSARAHRKSKKMPRLSKMPQLTPAGRTGEDERAARPSPDLNRPPTPDLVQDLSMKKRPASVSSHTSSSSHPESSSRKKDSHNSQSAASSSASTSSSSSSSKKPPPLVSTTTSYPMSLPMHSSFADMTAQHMESLFGTGHLPPKLPMFFHPAAAMMTPMLDGSMSLLLPPPPSSAQAAAAAASSGRRGRGRGRGSRSGGSASNSTSTSSSQGSRKGRGGRGRGGNSRSRTASTSSSSSAGMDYAALSQLQEEHHQAALREHMELQLKAHHQMAALGMMQDPHQMAALQRASQDSQKEATNKLHQLADKHANRNSEEKSSKVQSSKLSNALMGQMPTSLPKSYPPSKHSEGPTDSDMEDLDSSEAISASSSSDSESEDSDVDAQSSQESETQGSKRPGEESDSATPRKRRRTHEIDETEIRIPLEHGWRRQTRLRGIGSRGLIGEVVYFAPCGKKLKTVPDVARYLDKNNITDLVRANFTFSTKLNVGDFLEARSEDGNSGYVALTEEEVVERFMLIATQKRAKLVAKQERAERRRLRKLQSAEMAQRMAEMKMAKKHEQQEMTRRIAEMKMRRKLERQQAREAARRDKQMKAEEMKKMKEQERLMRQQEKVQRQEQMRIEREMRAQQIMEEKQRRKDELQRRLYEDALEKAKDREMKRQQQVMMKEQDRERRRQHMLLVKALEARKRYEERERAKEEKIKEKIMERDRKMEQRRIEMEMAREMQKPVEDMLLNNHQELPTLERIPGQCLAGEAFADCLMVIEFLHNFGTALGFDDESLPTIQELHSALLNDEDEVEELVTVFTHILKFAIDDPGFPNPKEAVTASGLKIADLEVTEENMSELLRIFVRARNGKDDEMTDWLLDKPLLALTPTQKAACLAFLCNELLSSKSVYGEIEKNIETLGNLRKDKWMAEGKVRKLRMMQAKKLRADTKAAEAGSEAAGSKKGSDDEDDGKEQDDDNESGNESDVTNATGNVSDEDEEMSLEELEKKIEKVNKQQNTNDRKAVDCVNRLRATDLGQDRYKRRYWVLPKAGGVFVEGLESAEVDEEQEDDSDVEADDSKKEEAEEVDDEDDGVKDETKPNEAEEVPATPEKKASEGENRIVNGIDKVEASPKVKEENTDTKDDRNDVEMKDESESCKDKDKETKAATSATVKNSNNEPVDRSQDERLVNGVKEEVHDGTTTGTNEKKGLLDTIHTKVEQLSQLDELETTCVKVELNGKRTDEAMVLENGEVKAENGLDHQHHQHHEGKPALCGGIKEEEDVEMKAPCEMNGSREVEDANDFKVPNAASLLAKAEGISKLHDVLGSPPVLHRNAQSIYSTPPPSSLDIFKTAQNNNYCIPNSHAEIASSFRSIDSILGSADHKSTPTSSSVTCTPVAGMATPTSTSTSPVFNSSFLSPHDVLSSTPVSTEQVLKTLSQQGTPDTWFSILPRMPCDESSITRCSPSQAAGAPGGVTGTSVGNSSYASPSHCSMYSTPGGYPSSHRGSPIDFHYYDRSMCNTPSMHDSLIQFGEMVDKHVHTKPKPIPKALQRGWWRITNTEQLQTVLKCMHTRGVRERCLQQGLEKYMECGTQNADFGKDLIKIEETDAFKEVVSSKTGAPEPDARCGWSEEECTKAEAAALEEVEDLEERVFGASLQVKGCTLPHKVSEDDETASRPKRDEEDDDDEQEPLERARQHLLQLEKNIERRYIKPPLAKGVQINLANLSGNTSLPHDDSDGDEEEEDLPAALLRWRQAVLKAVSAAQLHLCVHQLNKCIAWEKSIMKVSCQICCKDDNEAELLLCDSCDKGYHTYCFRPKMEDIPDGDWYCCACISKATGEPTCVVCCKKGPKIASCDHCSYAMHIECMNPPLPRVPRRYTCYTCSLTKNKGKKRTRKPSTKVPPKVTAKETKAVEKSPTKNESDTSQTEPPTPEKEKKGKKKQQQATPPPPAPPPPPPPQPQQQQQQQQQQQKAQQQQQQKQDDKETNKKEEKEKESKKTEKKPDKRKGDKSSLRESSRNADKTDLTPCRTLLSELERHEEAWPFLQPVNHKQFPSYRKVIKHAMDVSCLKHKLRDSVYKMRDEFAADVRLMFNNCQLFNEDESEVGQAGFILRSFFEKRWRELGCS